MYRQYRKACSTVVKTGVDMHLLSLSLPATSLGTSHGPAFRFAISLRSRTRSASRSAEMGLRNAQSPIATGYGVDHAFAPTDRARRVKGSSLGLAKRQA